MTTYRIVGGTLSLGPAGTLGVQSGGVVLEYATSGWRAFLNVSEMSDLCPPYSDCNLAVDLEGGGELRGCCSVVEVGSMQAQVESGCDPDQFVEPSIGEAE